MKRIALVICSLPVLVLAKDPCSKIKVHRDSMRGFTSYTSPQSPVSAYKRVTERDSAVAVIFTMKLTGQLQGYSGRVKGIFVLFEDGSRFANDTSSIVVEPLAYGNTTLCGATVYLNDSTTSIFMNKKIKRFGFGAGGLNQDVSRLNELGEYLKCLTR